MGNDTLQTGGGDTKRPLITDSASNVVNLADGNTVKGLQLDPQGGGGISGGSGDAGGTIDDVLVTDTGTAGTAPGLDLNGTSGTYNIRGLQVNNTAATTPPSTEIGVRLNNNSGTVNFIDDATNLVNTINNNGAKGLDVLGTNMGTASVFHGIIVTNSGTGAVSIGSAASPVTGTTTLGDGAGIDLLLTTTSGTLPAFALNNAGTVSVPAAGSADVTANGGPAIDVSATTNPALPFDAVSSTNSATDGINLDGLGTGTFSATSGAIGGATGTGFNVKGASSGAISYPGDLNNGTGSTASISGRTGGAVTLSGNINDTSDAGGGISESNNSGGSVTFSGATKTLNTGASDAVAIAFPNGSTGTASFTNGGLNIDTTSGQGYSATGVDGNDGNVQVSGTSGNTIDTGSGKSLNITNVNVNATGETYDHIAGNGANAGILLNNTGTNNALAVQSSGSGTCTAADQTGCTGGTIQNTSGSDDSSTTPVGTGIVLKSTKGVSLTRMHLANNSNYAIRGDSVTGGFSLANSVLNGLNGTETPASAGSPYNESAIRFTELTGSNNSITNSAISGGVTDNLGVINSVGSLNRLTVQSSTFGNNSDTQGNRSIDVVGTGTATVNVTVDSSIFTASASHDFGLDSSGTAADVIVTNNTMSQSRPVSGPGAPATGAGNVKLTNFASSATTLNVAGNTMQGATGNAMLFVHDVGSGSLTGTVNNNAIGVAGTANSGSLEGDGIQLNNTGGTAGSSTSLAITNNQVRQYNNFGIELASGSSGVATETGNICATVTGNTVSNPGSNASISSIFQGIQLNTGDC